MAQRIVEKPVVLVVEDEALVRMNIVQVALDAGCEVLEAADAEEALTILESRDDICSVFTDVRMPGSMDGIRLARAIKGRWPPIRLVLMSGLDIPEDFELPIQSQFIRKPYANGQIIAALRQVPGVQY
jgi:two-component system, response regulator PdtaR